MILPDVNLLIYAINRNSPFHDQAREWWDAAVSAGTVALCWPAVVGFLRLATNRRVVVNPLSVEKATGIVDTWLARPDVHLLVPTSAHWGILARLAASHPGRREPDHRRPPRDLRHRARLHPRLQRRRLRTVPGAALAESDHAFPRPLTRRRRSGGSAAIRSVGADQIGRRRSPDRPGSTSSFSGGAARARRSSAGRRPSCPCTPVGRRWSSSSSSRRSSTTVERRCAHD